MTLITLMLLSQVQVQIQIPVPTITFPAPPPLVVVEPGIQVVEDHDEEIFFTDGWYWHRRDGRWFRNKEHNGKWVVVEDKIVPVGLGRIPHGRYKHWKRAVKEEIREEKRERKEERKEEKREKKHHKD